MILWTLTVDDNDGSIVTTLHATEEEAIAALVENYLEDEDYGDDPLEYATGRAGLVVYLDSHEMPLEILHGRDPDAACELDVYVGGVTTTYHEVDLDPGRGWLRTDWEDYKRSAIKAAQTEPFRRAVELNFDAFGSSQYIEDE